jgi:ATP-binding cassette, subfamily B, bacterial
VLAAIGLFWRASPAAALLSIVLVVLGGVLPVVNASLLRELLNEITKGGAAHPTKAVVLAVLVAAGPPVGTVLSFVSGYVGSLARKRTSVLVQKRLFERVKNFPGLRYFEDPAFHDRLRVAEQSAQDAPASIWSALQQIAQAALTIVGFAGAVVLIWPPMMGLLMAVAIPALFLQIHQAGLLASVIEETSRTQRRASLFRSLLIDFRAVKEMRLFGFGSLMHRRFVDSLDGATNASLAVERRSMFLQSILALCGGLASAFGLAVVANGVITGRFSAGDVALLIASMMAVQGSLSMIVFEIGTVGWSLKLFPNYLDVIEAPDDLDNGTLQPRRLSRGIQFEDVWFRYDADGPWVLRGVDFFVPASSATGLVGLNGAGKSTLVKLLCRFYDAERGRILWDGTDLREFDIAEYRRRIAVTFQDYATYDLTAAENVGLGDIDFLDDRRKIESAAGLAEIDEALASLPFGYDTMLSRTFLDTGADERGVTLSGGQWQRVALARSLMRDQADLLILDEPSSGLDALAEHQVHMTLQKWRRGKTSLLISHRLSAIRNADLIVVLEGGEIVESGSHDDLISHCGSYARLFTTQAGAYLKDGEAAGVQSATE